MYNNNDNSDDNQNYQQLNDISNAKNYEDDQNQNSGFDYPEQSQVQEQPKEKVKNYNQNLSQDQELQLKASVHQTDMGNYNNNNQYTNDNSFEQQQGYQAPYMGYNNNQTGLISDTEQGNQQLQIGSLKIEGCNMLKKDTFHSNIASQLQEMNPSFGPLQILTDQRIQSIKQSFVYLRKLGGGILLGSILLCFIMIILYFCTFKYYGYWFAKTWMVIAMLLWVLQVVLFGYSCIKTNQQYLKISFLYVVAVMCNFLILVCIITSRIPGGYVFMGFFQLFLQGASLYGMFLMNKEIEKMNNHIQSQR